MIHDPIQAARDLNQARQRLHNIRALLHNIQISGHDASLDDAAMQVAIDAVTAIIVDCYPDASSLSYIDHAKDAARHAASLVHLSQTTK
jgi:hypothetical protein